MGQTSHLPIELIYRIIEAGCLMELRQKTSIINPYPRRRLAFASLVREVCSLWRDTIDLSTDGHFWVAILDLSLSVEKTNTNFPRQLMKFHRDLTESQGCNLIVCFRFSVDERFKVSAQVYKTEPADVYFDITLRLFLHGLRMILPYQRQLFGIRMEDSQPQVDRSVYELLCSVKDAPRLTVLYLGNVRWYRPTGSAKGFYRPSWRDIQNLEATVPNFQPILLKNDMKTIRSILSIEHFRNLHTLSISNPGWLSEMALPSQLSGLWINGSQEDSLILRNLAANPILCASLTSLGIRNINPSDAPAKNTSITPEHVSLPCLHSIQVLDFPANVNEYITHMHLPRIDDASIIFRGQPPTTRIPQAASPLITFLSRLNLTCNESWITLSVLSRLASPSLRHLRLWFQEDGSHLGYDFSKQFGDCLASIQPETLEIGSDNLKWVFFILGRLSRSNLMELSLNWHPSVGEIKQPPTSTMDPETDENPKSIVSSSLAKLTLTWMPLHLIHAILSHLDSHALKELTIAPPWDKEPLPSAATIQTNHHDQRGGSTLDSEHCALVSKFCFSHLPLFITSTLLRQFFNLVSNAYHVILDIGSNWAIEGTTHLEGPPIHKTSFHNFWIPVCEAIRPDTDSESGLCPLLRLTTLVVSFPLESEDLEEPLSMFSRAFRVRADAGAPYLKLKIPEERHRIKRYKGEVDTPLVRLTFEYSGEK